MRLRRVGVCVLTATVILTVFSRATPTVARTASSRMLAASGPVLRDNNGTGSVVDLRGTNLGGWLMFEGWMSPAGEAALDRNGWTASASSSSPGDAPSNVLDGSSLTRWSTGRPQTQGDRLVVDLGKTMTFDQISFDAGPNSGDYPSGFQVQTSADNSQWQTITTGVASTQNAIVKVNYTSARYVAIALTANKSDHWWSVSEFNLYVSDEWNTRRVLRDRFGAATADSLIVGYQSSWLQASDLDAIKALGFNAVRAPINWQNLMNDDGSMKSDATSFGELDWLVNQAAMRGLYVIIDLHAVPGGDCPFQSCGRAGVSDLWASSTDQSWTQQLWTRIASHYAGNATVAGYDLLNEPVLTNGSGESTDQIRQKFDFYNRLYAAVRNVDPSHLIIIEAFPSWSDALPPSAYGWTNAMYESHHYDFGAQDDAGAMGSFIDDAVANIGLYRALWNVPVYAGEFWFGNHPDLTTGWLQQLDRMHVSWTNWTYKLKNAPGSSNPDGVHNADGWSFYYDDPAPIPDINNDDAQTIAAKWQQFSTNKFRINSDNQTLYPPQATSYAASTIPGTIYADGYTAMSGMQTEPTTDASGGLDVGYVNQSDALSWDVTVAGSGAYSLQARLASPNGAPSAFTLTGSGVDLTLSAPMTGGWQNWTTVSATVYLTAGRQTLHLQALSAGWNINWLYFERS